MADKFNKAIYTCGNTIRLGHSVIFICSNTNVFFHIKTEHTTNHLLNANRVTTQPLASLSLMHPAVFKFCRV